MLLSPDGIWYLRRAEGLRVPSPYHRRWLLPRLLGPHPYRWAAITYASLAATPFAAWLYFDTLAPAPRVFAALLLLAVPGVWRCSLRFPVLTDAPSFALALVVAWLARVCPLAAVPCALVLGATRESAPVFAALWAWHPLPLVGLVAVKWWGGAPTDDALLAHPIRSALALRRAVGLDASLYLRPWGAALLAVPSWRVGIAVLVAHAQLFLAVDTIRLTVWCAPVLVASVAIPAALWPLALLVTVMGREDRV